MKEYIQHLRSLQMERAHIVFGVIYFPVAFLFLNRGFLAEFLLMIYTMVMAVLGVALLAKFALRLSAEANAHSGKYGSILIFYLLNALGPLLMFKVYGYVILRMLPVVHRGIWCDIKYFIVDLMSIFQFQDALNTAICLSLAVVTLGAFIAVGHDVKKS